MPLMTKEINNSDIINTETTQNSRVVCKYYSSTKRWDAAWLNFSNYYLTPTLYLLLIFFLHYSNIYINVLQIFIWWPIQSIIFISCAILVQASEFDQSSKGKRLLTQGFWAFCIKTNKQSTKRALISYSRSFPFENLETSSHTIANALSRP